MSQPITPETQAVLLQQASSAEELSRQILHSSVAFRRKFEDDKREVPETILNVVEFAALLQFDLACLLSEMVRASSDLRANLFARLSILTVHESFLTLRRLLARPFREDVRSLMPTVDESFIKLVHSAANDVFEWCNEEFRDVRHGIVAHRDLDATERVRLLQAAEVERVGELVIRAYTALDPLNRLIHDLLRALEESLKKG